MLLAVGLAVVCISSGAQAPQQSTANPAVPAQAPPSSQEVAPSQTPAIRASSDLVRIDVEVTDKSGKAVKGLTPEQFSISENGKAQKISIFTFQDIEKMETAQSDDTKPIVVAIDSPNTPAAAEAISNQVRDRRMLVLFFDLTSMQTDDIARAHDAALKFVQKQMTSADLVSIVTYAARLTVWADFTNDRAKLEKAVARLTPDVASQLADLSYAAAQNGEYDIQQYTGAAYTADETEFNAFNTDQKLSRRAGSRECSRRDSRTKSSYRIHGWDHADRRRKSYGIASGHRRRQSRRCLNLFHRCARSLCRSSGRRRHHERCYRHVDVHGRLRISPDRCPPGFARHAGDALL